VCARCASLAAEHGRSSSSLDLDMRLTPDRPALRRWRLWVGRSSLQKSVGSHSYIRGSLETFARFLRWRLLPLTVVGYVYLMAPFPRILLTESGIFGFVR